MFQVGDKAIYPGHGVVTVEQVREEFVGSKSLGVCYTLRMSTGATVKVPIEREEATGLRPPIDRAQMQHVLAVFEDVSDVGPTARSWTRRQRALSEKIRTGDVFDLAEVCRDLRTTGSAKRSGRLSYGERNMLDLVEDLLFSELSVVSGEPREALRAQIDQRVAAAKAA